ncbi:SRPBCC family protein [Pelagibacterium xiamenense]|uniref:SRPBCC family protein n=1 Tax=Pelagibacterium xiamenense TaxID=2901140 RepID=UPI001E32F45E|nr:SRPBCC domain-containing protein [Pelagibacterium xiamenense]MCD7060366.1 SRPBCC domain-containing protein [Pelagibacterium xiamenense]
MTELVTAAVERRFPTMTPGAVFDAWVNPAKIRRWLQRNNENIGRDSEVTVVEVEPQEGGAYRFVDVADGEEGPCWGTYLTFERPSRLDFTFFIDEDEERDATSVVRIRLEPDGAGCRATLAHEMDAKYAEYIESTKKAWAGMLRAIEETYAED